MEFTERLSGFEAQDFHGQLAHDVRERVQEKHGCGRFVELLMEGLIICVYLPQLIELTMQIGDGLDLLSGHGSNDGEAKTKRRDEALAFGNSELFAALIEDIGIEDSLELVGHGGNLSAIHSRFLSLIEGR